MEQATIWILVEVTCQADALESLESICWDFGTLGIEEALESTESRFKAYFNLDTNCNDVEQALNNWSIENDSLVQVRQQIIHDEGWKTSWHAYFHPQVIGRFIIHPPWEIPTPDTHIPIAIFPGQAFGTGYHESTQLCIQLIEELDLMDRDVCDAGCGSGILTIIAAKSPLKRIVAFDIDPLAIEETNRNISGNTLLRKPLLCVSNPDSFRSQSFDLILANLDSPTLRVCYRQLCDMLRPHALLAISGIVTECDSEISELLTASGCRLIKRVSLNEWVAFLWTK